MAWVALPVAGCATLTPAQRQARLQQIEQRLAALASTVQSLQAVWQEAPAFPAAALQSRPRTPPRGVSHYGDPAVFTQRLDETYRTWAAEELSKNAATAHLRSIEFHGPNGRSHFGPPWRADQHYPAIAVPIIWAVASTIRPETVGGEFDMRVPDAEGEPWRLTVWYELDGRLRVEATQSKVSVCSEPTTPEALTAQFGIGPVENGTADWKAAELTALRCSLFALSPQELALVGGIRFRRMVEISLMPGSAHGDDTAAGLFIIDNQEDLTERIELSDLVFENMDLSFVGRLDTPASPAARIILHEIGHAITEWPVRKLMRLHRDFNHLLAEFPELGKNPRITLGAAHGRAAQINAVLQPLLALSTQVHPIAAAYATLDGVLEGPTAVGRTTLHQSLAESFSLYHLDPEALRRFSHAAHRFFAEGRHLPAANMFISSHSSYALTPEPESR